MRIGKGMIQKMSNKNGCTGIVTVSRSPLAAILTANPNTNPPIRSDVVAPDKVSR
jgi:hypothetical protein